MDRSVSSAQFRDALRAATIIDTARRVSSGSFIQLKTSVSVGSTLPTAYHVVITRPARNVAMAEYYITMDANSVLTLRTAALHQERSFLRIKPNASAVQQGRSLPRVETNASNVQQGRSRLRIETNASAVQQGRSPLRIETNASNVQQQERSPLRIEPNASNVQQQERSPLRIEPNASAVLQGRSLPRIERNASAVRSLTANYASPLVLALPA